MDSSRSRSKSCSRFTNSGCVPAAIVTDIIHEEDTILDFLEFTLECFQLVRVHAVCETGTGGGEGARQMRVRRCVVSSERGKIGQGRTTSLPVLGGVEILFNLGQAVHHQTHVPLSLAFRIHCEAGHVSQDGANKGASERANERASQPANKQPKGKNEVSGCKSVRGERNGEQRLVGSPGKEQAYACASCANLLHR